MFLNVIHHVAIIVSDYEKSREFYVEKLELPIIRENYREDRDDYKLDLQVGDIDLEKGKDIGMDGQEHVFGIPMDTLYGLTDYNVDPADMFLCIPLYSLNQENAVRTVNTLIEQLTAPKPDWYDAYKERQISSYKPKTIFGE